MGLRDIGATLPPGFRFYPSDEELVCHYLYKKIANEEVLKGTLVEIDLHTCEPWQLPELLYIFCIWLHWDTTFQANEDWVLCRVFHKSKSEDNSTQLSPPFLFDTTAANNASSCINSSGAVSPPLTDRSCTMPFGYHPHQISSSTPPYQNHSNQTSSVLDLLQFSQEKNTNQITEITSKCDDDYGFLWDMNLEETNLENGVASNMEGIRFDQMDNSLVFL
ncbi:hypothetical protein EZV62_010833 [Acer yangbiense]|uniref:NAC domain-containing protein n=1 Tax=Acer yangbiense TaxID=1000413 RepID=A0A5C7I4M9_9ROSI|nr:hypothetical protein EZV62_010833 [Acer yangbiense]